MTTPAIAVTGATGNIGGRVAALLAQAGARQRLVVRDASRAPALTGADVAVASFGAADAIRAGLTGVRVVLMVSASESADRLDQHRTFVDAAAAAGVEHVVYLSVVRASPTSVFTLARDHARTEEHLRASGMAWTMLRDNLYQDFIPLLVGDDDTIRGPAGDGRVAAVAQRDVAASAAAVLRDAAAHTGRTYDVTGPEALTLTEAAERLTAAAGRAIGFVDETVDEAYASRAATGAPQWQLDAWVSTYTAAAAGEWESVSGDVERLTGRPTTTLAETLRSS